MRGQAFGRKKQPLLLALRCREQQPNRSGSLGKNHITALGVQTAHYSYPELIQKLF